MMTGNKSEKHAHYIYYLFQICELKLSELATH